MGTQSGRHGEAGTWSVLPDGLTVRIANFCASCPSMLYRLGPDGSTLVDADGQVMFRRAGDGDAGRNAYGSAMTRTSIAFSSAKSFFTSCGSDLPW